jgi:hypothetical protein
MAKRMVWLSGVVPYEQCQAVFERIGERLIPASSIWRQTQRYGQCFEQHMLAQQEHVAVERVVLPEQCHDHAQQKGISLDGGMVNIRGEGWKEFKMGTVFDVAIRLERDPRTNELVQRPHAQQITYTAVLGSVEQFAPAMWTLAVEQDVPSAADSSVTADGAEWIWNLVADIFPASLQIIDWYHALERLANAAKALFPDDEHQFKRWFNARCDDLFQGKIWKITNPLDEHSLLEHSRYFHVHQRRMQYQEFQEQLYPIGSGTVESGIKQFKARLTGAGMRWTRQAAQQMLIIRAAVLGKTFDRLWAVA